MMNRVSRSLCEIALAVTCSGVGYGQTRQAVATDPVPDKSFPAKMAQVSLTSAGSTMHGLVYMAAGPGPHPTVVLLHGFPGFEQNLDLAQAIRRAGWNVLYFHYRGSWGSEGKFAFTHCEEDTIAATAWAREPANVKKYAIAPDRLVLIGHSMGGLMAAYGLAEEPKIAGAVLISAWDPAREVENPSPEKDKVALAGLQENVAPLMGTSAPALLAEIKRSPSRFDFLAMVPRMKDRPVLVIDSNDGLAEVDRALAAKLQAAGDRRVTEIHMDTDHAYSDHRIALETAVVEWLGKLQ